MMDTDLTKRQKRLDHALPKALSALSEKFPLGREVVVSLTDFSGSFSGRVIGYDIDEMQIYVEQLNGSRAFYPLHQVDLVDTVKIVLEFNGWQKEVGWFRPGAVKKIDDDSLTGEMQTYFPDECIGSTHFYRVKSEVE